jgi:4a-hydroxytetrahydrobiopterin dehydratase
MSEQGWREFLAADGVDDWVVLHGGATAVFKVGSIGEAARLAAAVAEIDGFEGSGVLLAIVDASLTVRLTRGPLQLESRHVDLARAVSKVASAQGAVADRASVQEVQLAIASKPDVDPLGHGSTVWMQELDEAKPLRHAMHVDVSVARDHVEGRLAAALAAGGRVVWESEEHWTLADRAGNRVCITAGPDGATKAPPDPA